MKQLLIVNNFFLIFCVLFSGCSLLKIKPQSEALTFSFQCMLVNMDGQTLRRTYGNLCTYFEDGSLIVGSQTEMSLISDEGRVIWSLPLNTHHNLKNINQTEFLVMNSSFDNYKKKWLRFDRISIYNKSAQELKYFDFSEHAADLTRRSKRSLNAAFDETFKSLQKDIFLLNVKTQEKFKPVFYEFSHANSVYRIPKNKMAKFIPAFAEGNFIVNINGLQLMLILDSELKSIIWSHEGLSPNTHDVQVIESGEILVYNNSFTEKSSAIELFNPLTKSRKVLYKGTPDHSFFATTQGSVQILPTGHLLISEIRKDELSRFFEVDQNGRFIREWPARTEGLTGNLLSGLQEVKIINANKFLKNNKSLF